MRATKTCLDAARAVPDRDDLRHASLHDLHIASAGYGERLIVFISPNRFLIMGRVGATI